MQDLPASYGVPGAVLGVSVPGQGRFVGTSGTADKDDPTPVRPDLRFRIGSITKTFTATTVLQLVDDCLVGLDDTIGRFQPGLPYAGQVTVRELLNHTTGIPDYAGTPRFVEGLGKDPLRVWGHQELVDMVAGQPLAFPPGTQWEYSNTNYIILGLIVEKLTGRPLEQVMSDRVLAPLHLGATSFPTTPAISAPATGGTEVAMNAGPPPAVLASAAFNFDPSAYWAAGAMISDLTDLEAWARALATGSLLSPAVQAQRLSFVPTVGPESPAGDAFPPLPPLAGLPSFPGPTLPVGYGLGVADIGGYIGHNGDVPGYSALMVFEPRTGTTVVVVQNGSIVVVDKEAHHRRPVFLGLALPPSNALASIAGILGQAPVPVPPPVTPVSSPCPPPGPPNPPAPSATPAAKPADAVAARPSFTG